MTLVYLSAEEIVVVNRVVTGLSGGTHGLRDRNLLESIVLKPQTTFSGNELYPELHLKAAVLFEALVNYHVFVDGNKRTGFAAMAAFLDRNGYQLEVSNKEIVTVCLNVATKKLELAEIALWVKEHIYHI